MLEIKRKPEENSTALIVKRPRNEGELTEGIKRFSGLQAPIMLLTGHKSEIFTCKFSPTGAVLASGSFDKNILLWNTYGNCANYATLCGHSNAVLELKWSSDGSIICSASADKTLFVWDASQACRIRKLKEHSGIVNSCCTTKKGQNMICSGSDDKTIKLWDPRSKNSVQTLNSEYQVTSVCFNEMGDQIISGGIDNDIKIWDIRKQEIILKMPGHLDTVTGLSLSPDGSYLLSNGMDSKVCVWDIRPFAMIQRCLKVFEGAPHSNFEYNLIRCSWSADGTKIAAGASDRTVVIWDIETLKILYKLPGHKGCVNDVDFHPNEPILLSCGSDKQIFLGELEL